MEDYKPGKWMEINIPLFITDRLGEKEIVQSLPCRIDNSPSHVCTI
jgi:hypothetical protein